MHGVARRGFDGFQIETARLALTGTDDPQESIYFEGDFLFDRIRRFFS
jgi:hypothetical protein